MQHTACGIDGISKVTAHHEIAPCSTITNLVLDEHRVTSLVYHLARDLLQSRVSPPNDVGDHARVNSLIVEDLPTTTHLTSTHITTTHLTSTHLTTAHLIDTHFTIFSNIRLLVVPLGRCSGLTRTNLGLR